MNLEMHIHKIKCIDDLKLSFPMEKGLYAITGQNGSGKSTIAACTSTAFYYFRKQDFFGETDIDAYISFEFDGKTLKYSKKNEEEWTYTGKSHFPLHGFYEGSLIYGTRFKDTAYGKLKYLSSIKDVDLEPASDYIRRNLGIILQGNENFYEKLWILPQEKSTFSGNIFFYEKNGKRISQFHMSTGENLLLSVLYSLNLKNEQREKFNNKEHFVIFLDEIELALHPSSLKRLITFLSIESNKFSYAIYFSTHSIELISGIKPDNIFYVERYNDNTISVKNPCYPAYATKFLYDQSGYDNIILVEDDLAREIILQILRTKRLMSSRMVHVLPCGGYSNVITLADDVVRNNLLGKTASVMIILDKDVEDKANKFIVDNGIANNIPLNFLPVDSLEKYLKDSLFVHVDHEFYTELNDYVFLQKSLAEMLREYRTNMETWLFNNPNKGEFDKDGKKLYKLLEEELKLRNKDRSWLISEVVRFLFEIKPSKIQPLVAFLERKFNNN